MTVEAALDPARLQTGSGLAQVLVGLRELSVVYSDLAIGFEARGLPRCAEFLAQLSRRCHAAGRCIARHHPAATAELGPLTMQVTDRSIGGVLMLEENFDQSMSSLLGDARKRADYAFESVISKLAKECLERTSDVRRLLRVAMRSDNELERYAAEASEGSSDTRNVSRVTPRPGDRR